MKVNEIFITVPEKDLYNTVIKEFPWLAERPGALATVLTAIRIAREENNK